MGNINVNPQTDQFAPVPQHTDVPQQGGDGGAKFKQILGGAASIAGQLVSSVGGAQTLGLGPLVGNLAGALNGGFGNGPLNGGDLTQLLQTQNEIQRQSLVFNAQTNISKTDYDTQMSAVRNIKT